MMKKILLFSSILVFTFFNSCTTESNFEDISSFQNIEALGNQKQLRIIQVSNIPLNEEDLSYFIKVVAILEESGDTVNILTPFIHFTEIDNNKTVYKYSTLDSDEGADILGKIYSKNDKSEVLNKILDIQRVASKSSNDIIKKNNFSTYIGIIEEN